MTSSRPEQLRIVFALGVEIGPEVRVGESDVRPLTPSQHISGSELLEGLTSAMAELNIREDFVTRSGERLPLKAVKMQVTNEDRWRGSLETDELSFSAGHAAAYRQSFLLIREKKPCAEKFWDAWVKPFVSRPDLVQAWVSDCEYERWQNASDPNEYLVAGRSMLGLATKSNSLPAPLDRQIIDTSKNPGRWELRDGYTEAIGPTMWLANLFWSRVGQRRRHALASIHGIRTIEFSHDVLKLISEVPMFDEKTSIQQDELRMALYGARN
jgi:hypothetical protein